MFGRVPFAQFMLNSVVITVVTVVLGIIVNSMAAFALARIRFRFSGIVYSLIALTWLVPIQVVMIPNYLLVANLGLIDTVVALVLRRLSRARRIERWDRMYPFVDPPEYEPKAENSIAARAQRAGE